MDWSLTAEQRHWRDTARAYATEVVAPRAPALDADPDPEAALSWDLVDAATEYGLRLAPLPPAFGGGGTDFLTNAVMLEEIAAADLGTSVVLAQTWKFAQLLMELGTTDQHERWLRRLVDNRRGLMAASLTEPNGGSDNVLPYAGVDGGMQTSARKVDGGWVLNGQKIYSAIFYDDVFVPDADLLGRENEGLADVARLLYRTDLQNGRPLGGTTEVVERRE